MLFVFVDYSLFPVIIHSNFMILPVTKANRAELALSMLRENRNGFDVVISDVHMPDMDGFKLLEHVGLEMDLPVISEYPFSFSKKLSFIFFFSSFLELLMMY